MITIAKLRSLRPRTQIRKISMIFHQAAKGAYSPAYLSQVIPLLMEEKAVSVLGEHADKVDKLCTFLLMGHWEATYEEDLCQLLLQCLGAEPSDWDFTDDAGLLDGGVRSILPHTLVLDRLRSPFNVGSIFRTADSFGVDRILMVEGTASTKHPRCFRTAKGTIATVAHKVLEEDEICNYLASCGRPVFALESGGTLLYDFVFPRDGIAVLGSEEFGVSPRLLALCDASSGRVTIPLSGSKGSINVSVAAGIMLQAWFSVSV